VKHRLMIISHVRLDGDVRAAYAQSEERVAQLAEILDSPLPAHAGGKAAAAPAAAEPLRSNKTPEQYQRMVEAAKEHIAAGDAFQLAGKRTLALPLLADGESVVAQVSFSAAGTLVSVEGATPAGDAFAVVAGNGAYVLRNGRQTKVTLRDLALEETGDQGQGGLVRAPMHGKVLAVLVAQGATVTRGQRVAIVEAMKMEHTLVAPIDGVVIEIAVAANAQVAEGAKVIVIEALPPA